MSTIRPDVSAFSRSCERLLSEYLDPPLTDDEQQFVAYYLGELTGRLKANQQQLQPMLPASDGRTAQAETRRV